MYIIRVYVAMIYDVKIHLFNNIINIMYNYDMLIIYAYEI